MRAKFSSTRVLLLFFFDTCAYSHFSRELAKNRPFETFILSNKVLVECRRREITSSRGTIIRQSWEHFLWNCNLYVWKVEKVCEKISTVVDVNWWFFIRLSSRSQVKLLFVYFQRNFVNPISKMNRNLKVKKVYWKQHSTPSLILRKFSTFNLDCSTFERVVHHIIHSFYLFIFPRVKSRG